MKENKNIKAIMMDEATISTKIGVVTYSDMLSMVRKYKTEYMAEIILNDNKFLETSCGSRGVKGLVTMLLEAKGELL